MDHAQPGQSTGAVAPTVEDRLSALADGMLSESADNPNAWQPEQQAEEATEQTEAPTETQEVPETTPAEEMEEVEYAEGKKYQVPKELKRGWLREDDYTRKTQKLADTFKAVDTSHQAVVQQAQVLQALAPRIGQLSAMDGQIQALNAEMTPELEMNDPMRFSTLAARLSRVERQRDQLHQHLSIEQQRIVQGLDQARQQTIRARMDSEMPILEQTVKDFTPDKHGREVRDYLRRSGLSQEAQSFIEFSPAAIALVWKAKAFDQLQADKTTAQKKVEKLPPVAKPGQRTSQAEADVQNQKLRDLNRKTGGKDPEIRRELLRRQLFGK